MDWIEEAANDLPSVELVLVACLKEPQRMPMDCPACGAGDSVHLYFDKQIPACGAGDSADLYFDKHGRNRLGSVWVWCDACRHYTHGSVRPPGWWENLEVIDRSRLCGLPEYVIEFSDQIDAHWGRVLSAYRSSQASGG